MRTALLVSAAQIISRPSDCSQFLKARSSAEPIMARSDAALMTILADRSMPTLGSLVS